MMRPFEASKNREEDSSKVSAGPTKEAPLKVLHVYAGNLYGGIETFLRTLAEERHQCPEMVPEFALCFEGRLADEIRASGTPLHMLGGVRLSRPWTTLRAQVRLRNIIRARRPDVVVSHAVWPYVLFGPIARLTKTRLAFYQHDVGRKTAPLNVIAERIRPDVYIANSRFTASHAYPKWQGISPLVVYPAVRVPKTRLTAQERRDLRTALGASDDDVVILQASRMQPMKGQHLLLEALAALDTSTSWRCWVVGEPQRTSEAAHMADLKRKVEDSSLGDRVMFLGQRNDLPQLMQSADIFCQPNLAPESFGLVFVEALAAGLPVITTDVSGGALEIIDGTCSRVSPATGPELRRELVDFISAPRQTLRDAASRRLALLPVDPSIASHNLMSSVSRPFEMTVGTETQ